MTRPDGSNAGERKRPERPPIEVGVRDLDLIREKTPVYIEPTYVALGVVALLIVTVVVFAGGYFLGRTYGVDTLRPTEAPIAAAAANPISQSTSHPASLNGATRGQVLPRPTQIVPRLDESALATDRRGEEVSRAIGETAETIQATDPTVLIPSKPADAPDGDGFWPPLLVTDPERCSSCIVADGACGLAAVAVEVTSIDPTAKADASPAKADASPAKADASPAKADASPAKADASPAKADASPVTVALRPEKVESTEDIKAAKPSTAPAAAIARTTKAPVTTASAPPAAVSTGRPNTVSNSHTTWAIQARAFRDEPLAVEYVASLKKQGYTARVVSFADGAGFTWYRIRLGRFSSLAEAQSFAAKFNNREHEQAITVEVP